MGQAVAEGAGISLLMKLADTDTGEAAGAQGASGLVVRGARGSSAADHGLPVLARDASPEDAAVAGADAVVLHADDDELADLVERAAALGLEVVVEVRDKEGLERALDRLDPEILLLSAEAADTDDGPLAHVLELLPDIPAGKFAIAALAHVTREDVEELERAGVDAVVVPRDVATSGDLVALVGDEPPEV